ncbi:MAG: hypothetical protein Q4G03_09270 [Planctomycetia bacterium]|nr:hypothetical protein [Planctomycetia bacterium]
MLHYRKKVLRRLIIATLVTWAGLTLLSCTQAQNTDATPSRPAPNLITDRSLGLTSYQQAAGYDPRYDLKTDVVMVYGVGDAVVNSLPEWREKSGSKVAIMTGIAWGGYGEFLNGNIDGIDHWDDAQVRADGTRVMHDPSTPYLVPSVAFTDYLDGQLRKLVDAGVDEFYLEEPELWAFAGFGESFQREWKIFYKEDWIRPDSTCDAQYRASKLKQYLYRRAIDRVASGLKEYSLKKYNRPVKVYVATHSLVSYAQIQMVSPEATLLDLPGVDGLIAQIWTGTSRFKNIYNGVEKERTFESALMEYGVMQEMARGTGQRIYYLNDPVEDNPNYDWDDYRTNYLCTLVASLMRSASSHYEVAPWPWRIMLGLYPAGKPEEAKPIPADYASILTLIFNQLRDMEGLDAQWLDAVDAGYATGEALPAPTEEIGALISDSAMFQRSEPTVRDSAVPESNDPLRPTKEEIKSLGDFFGLTMPLIKRGVPVEAPVLDLTLKFPGYLDPYKVLILSYDYQKPSSAGIHAVIADWVAHGGSLIFVDSQVDPYNDAKDWWNSSAPSFKSPGDHLMTCVGLQPGQEAGKYDFGSGKVYVVRKRPAYFNRAQENGEELCKIVAEAFADANGKYSQHNYFLKKRGPYLLASVLNESISEEPLKLHGSFVNLFDANLELTRDVTLEPAQRAWLLDLDQVTAPAPCVLASSARIESLTPQENGSIQIVTTCTSEIDAVMLLKLERQPKNVQVNGADPLTTRWSDETKTFYIKFRSTGAENITLEY